MAGLLHRVVRGDISISPETVQTRNEPSQVVVAQEVKAKRSPNPDRNAILPDVAKPQPVNGLGPLQAGAAVPNRYSLDLDDLDLCDGFPVPWLVALPEALAGPLCPDHGCGYWWEGRHDGRLHCVACWSAPPIRSLVVRVWQSARGDAPILAGCGFAPDQIVFVTRTDGAAPWPWQDNQPAEPAFV